MGELEIPPYKYLPDVFDDIIDEFEYTLPELAQITGKSVITLRRYCTNGLVKIQKKRPYIVKGIDIKEMLFPEHLPYIIKRLKLISHLHDKIQFLVDLHGEDEDEQ